MFFSNLVLENDRYIIYSPLTLKGVVQILALFIFLKKSKKHRHFFQRLDDWLRRQKITITCFLTISDKKNLVSFIFLASRGRFCQKWFSYGILRKFLKFKVCYVFGYVECIPLIVLIRFLIEGLVKFLLFFECSVRTTFVDFQW